MAGVVTVGGGVVGLELSMMLARDGHDVVQLERDPDPPPDSVDAAWERWSRRGVAQFRLGHVFLARWRTIVETELPELLPAMEAAGALRTNPLLESPEQLHGGVRPDDGRYGLVTGRRVLVVEDIIDSGLTLNYLRKYLQSRRPATVDVCALLGKEGEQRVDLDLRYVGFTIPPEFVVGYGLDVDERFRNLAGVHTYLGADGTPAAGGDAGAARSDQATGGPR